ncbi:MAG TPA: hypothetical protein VFO86_04575 [Terriglobia bacterium]|nr:hypothetical protein [Terriglobia bacterium]
MKELLWSIFAFIVSRKPIANYLIRRAARTPYYDLPGYMNRTWLFNPYGKDADGNTLPPKYPNLPSARVHHILRRDFDDHPHDHPWDARSVILREGYVERDEYGNVEIRTRGDTFPIKFEQYHRITYVPDGGVWTLFLTWKYQGMWGFLVDGVKVPWREYFKLHPERGNG